jgi:enoyl-CoA hydratase/carnithine racemase
MDLETMFIRYDGPVATLHLNRSERLNAIGNQATIDLNTAADALAKNEEVRLVLITGEGRAFSTGIDLKELAAGEIDMSYHHRWETALHKLEQMDKVVIAVINGYCLGAGLQLALSCDLRIAAESARLGLPAVREGLIPGMSVWRLPRFIGLGRAKQLVLSGDMIVASSAQSIGLVDDVVADEVLMGYATEVSQRYLNMPWSSVLGSKQLMAGAFDMDYTTAYEQYVTAQQEAMNSPEHRAAVQRFVEEQARKRQSRSEQ